jgi:putative membrane protein
MTLLLHLGAGLASLFHVLFFLEESVLWMRPAVHHKTFGLSLEEARTARIFTFNQGFYNLFLAAGAAGGLAAAGLGHAAEGRAVAAFALASMAAAALVLLASKPKLWVGALVQGLPPVVALGAMWMGG